MGFLFSYRGFCWGEGNRIKKKKKRGSYARGDNHAAAPRASRRLISRKRVCPAVSKSTNFWPGLHQLTGLARMVGSVRFLRSN